MASPRSTTETEAGLGERHFDDKDFRVLIVDDDEVSLSLLEDTLAEEPYKLIRASSGQEALRILRDEPVDCLIVDMVMPEVSGLDVIRHVRKDKDHSAYLPAILITVSTDPEDRARAVQEGADEFCIKPLDPEVLRARLRTFSNLKKREQDLRARHESSQRLQQFREDMLHLLIHDLKNPLTVITMNIAYVLDELRLNASSEVREALHDAKSAGSHLVSMLSNLLATSQFESGKMELQVVQVPISNFLQTVLGQFAHIFRQKEIEILTEGVDGRSVAQFDTNLLWRVLENLILNAVRYTPVGGKVGLSVHSAPGGLTVLVRNTGTRIPLSRQAKLFQKFAHFPDQGSRHQLNLGLGLYFCRLAVEAHGGHISIEETQEWPVTFRIEIPQPPQMN